MIVGAGSTAPSGGDLRARNPAAFAAPTQPDGRCAAVWGLIEHVAGVRSGLHRGDRRGGFTDEHQLALSGPGDGELEVAAVDALRDLQAHLTGVGVDRSTIPEGGPHAEGRSHRSFGVTLTREREQ